MKKSILSVFVILPATVALMAFAYPSIIQSGSPQEKPALFPEDVQKIIETSCYDCHSDDASNLKAKTKLNFSKWSDLSDSKKVGKMENINEVIIKGEMPPQKYLDKFPEKAMTQDHKDIMNKWVTETSAKLMGE